MTEAAEVFQVAIDAEFILWLAGMSFAIIGFLLVVLARMIVGGINKTISNCHESLSARHDDHGRRIGALEDVVYSRQGGG